MSIKWVKLKKYCEETGETRQSVYAKRGKGIWLDDIHCKIGPDGNLWINTVEVEKWVEMGASAPTLQKLRRPAMASRSEQRKMATAT